MEDLSGKRIKDYILIERIGKGGMSVVYKAKHLTNGSLAAIKLIASQGNSSRSLLKQIENETHTIKHLANLTIVPLIGSGLFQNLPYLVMPYFDNGTLKQQMGKIWKYQDAARLLLPVARTLAQIHRQGVVHRDIKPSNMLVSEDGELILSDFGIAKSLLNDGTAVTRDTYTGMGTPEYMAPEQAQGKKIDGRVDIYSLGVVLYELVTGQLPYQAETTMGVIWQQAISPPVDPKVYAHELPKPVCNTILKALAVDVEDRFESMTQFADILEKIVEGKLEDVDVPVVTYKPPQLCNPPAGFKSKFGNNAKKYSFLTIVLLMVVIGLLLAMIYLKPEWQHRPEENPGLAQSSLSPSIVSLTPIDSSIPTLTLAPSRTPSFTPTIQSSPTPKDISLPTISADNILSMHSISARSGFSQPVTTLSTGEGEAYLAGGFQTNKLYIWGTSDNEENSQVLDVSINEFTSATISADQQYAAAGWRFANGKHTIRIWKLASGSLVRSLTGHTNTINDIEFSPSDDLLASASSDLSVIIWDMKKGSQIQRFWHSNIVDRVSFSPDEKILASGDSSGVVRIREVAGGNVIMNFNISGAVLDLNFSPDGKKLVAVSGRKVTIWDIDQGIEALSIDSDAKAAAFSPDSSLLVYFDSERMQIVIWSVSKMQEIFTIDSQLEVNCLAFSLDGSRLFAGGENGQVWLLGTD